MANSVSWPNAIDAAHVGLERFGDHDRIVRLLIILEDRDQRASDGKTGAVERMDKTRILLALGPIARVHAARLEVTAVRAGRNLAEHVLTGKPDLDVVGLPGRETHVAGTEHHGAVMNPEP